MGSPDCKGVDFNMGRSKISFHGTSKICLGNYMCLYRPKICMCALIFVGVILGVFSQLMSLQFGLSASILESIFFPFGCSLKIRF